MTKSQISTNSWLLLLVISLLFVNAHAAWLSDVPGEITQPDGTKINILWSGDEYHHWAHDESYFTMIQDQNTKLDLNQNNRFYQISLSKDDFTEIDILDQTSLIGNYPNPFNPSTTISFTLSQSENITLNIYNIKGQHVRTLINEIKEAGRYSIVWDGIDEKNNNVSSGIYFYRFETSSKIETKKMLLMK